MWTYKYPYKQLFSTKKRIELHAYAELFRGMHNERMIAFVGSGVTLPYGRLNWGELTRLLVMEIDALYHASSKSQQSNEAESLYKSLQIAAGFEESDTNPRIFLSPEKPFKPDVFVLELCADLCRALGQPDFLKKVTALHFRHGPIGQFGARLILLDGLGSDSIFAHWLTALGEQLNEFETNLGDGNAEKQVISNIMADWKKGTRYPRAKWLPESDYEIESHPKLQTFQMKFNENEWIWSRAEIEKIPWEILKTAMKNLPADVFNQPVPAEGHIYNHLHQGLELIAKKLLDIEIKNGKIPQNNGKKTARTTGWPDPIRTMTDTLKLRRFITLNYDQEIEKFFQRNREFDDHRHMVLDPQPSGDDGQNRMLEYYDGFRSRMTSVTLNDDMIGSLIDFSTLDEEDDYYVFHLHGRVDKPEDIILTERDYQVRYLRDDGSRTAFDEGMNTLFSGNDVLFLGVGMSEADLLQPLRQFMAQGERANRERDGTIAILANHTTDNKSKEDCDATERQAIKLHTQFGVKTICYDVVEPTNGQEGKTNSWHENKLKDQIKLAKKEVGERTYELSVSGASLVQIETKTRVTDPNDRVEIIKRSNFCKSIPENERDIKITRIDLMLKGREGTRLQAWKLDDALNKLAVRQKHWRQDWSTSPGKRLALFRNWFEGYDTGIEKNNKSFWIRQKVVHVAEQQGLMSAGLDDNEFYLALRGRLGNVDQGRHIERISGLPGVGKGQIVRALQFDTTNEHGALLKKDCYLGCFFADARYSTEFNSVVSALFRFLSVIIARKNGVKTFPELIDCGRRAHNIKAVGRSGMLRHYFEKAIEDLDHTEERFMVCLSGLDRLVDKTGYAFNAMHRSFFKVLTDPELADLPMDLVLISSKPDAPIRYLSEIDYAKVALKTKNSNSSFELRKSKTNETGIGTKLVPMELVKLPRRPDTNSQTDPLKPWPLFAQIPMKDRFWLPKYFRQVNKLITAKPGNDQDQAPALHKVILDNVSVHVWVVALVNEIHSEPDKIKAITDLDIAASRHGKEGVVRSILRNYTILDNADKQDNTARIRQEILRHLVYFTIPVERSVLVNCPVIKKLLLADLSEEEGQAKTEKDLCGILEDHLGKLFSRCLVTKIQPGRIHDKSGTLIEGDESDYRYTVHGLLRKTLAKKMGFDAYVHGEYSFFDVSLYSAQPRDLPSPDEYDYYRAGEILREFIVASRDQLETMFIRKTSDDKKREKVLDDTKGLLTEKLDSFNSISRRIRAGVNLVSGAFSIGVISRLESASVAVDGVCSDQHPFECYRSWLRGLLSAAIAVKQTREVAYEALNRKANPQDVERKFFIQTPLYETEIAWLYNERAVVSLIQGRLLDALPAFNLALQHIDFATVAMQANEQTVAAMTSARRIQLNQAIAIMEAGDVRKAQTIFEGLYQRKFENERNKTSLTANLAGGYVGLCNHLLGRLLTANDYYDEVLEYFKLNSVTHQRAASIFRHHKGNLLRALEKFDESDEYLRMSINAAASARQMDVFHHACVSRAKLMFDRSPQGDLTNAQNLIRNALQYAESLGVHTLRIHAETVQGEIFLAQQQFKASGAALTNAIALSNKYGLLLRKIAALELYARLLVMRGEPEQLCNKVFESAKTFAETAGYLIHTKRTVKRTSSELKD